MALLLSVSKKTLCSLSRKTVMLRYITNSINARSKRYINMAYISYESTETYSPVEFPPLIIMHGLFGSKANWSVLAKQLHKETVPKRKIIAVDARNHGDSPHSNNHSYNDLAEDIHECFKHFKIKKAALLGHSMGGRAMMTFSLQYPHLVEKLIVVDISPITTNNDLKTMPAIMTSMLKVDMPQNVSLATARLSANMQLSRTITDKRLTNFLLSNLVQTSDGRFEWRLNLIALLKNYTKHISKFPETNSIFDKPVLFISGEISDYIPKSDYHSILKIFPNAEFKTIYGAGHWLHSEKPKEFIEVCLDFLNKKLQ